MSRGLKTPYKPERIRRWVWANLISSELNEAASKALGTGFREGVGFGDFELFYDANKRPFININSKLDKRFRKSSTGKINSFVSISNEKNFVIAIVTIIAS